MQKVGTTPKLPSISPKPTPQPSPPNHTKQNFNHNNPSSKNIHSKNNGYNNSSYHSNPNQINFTDGPSNIRSISNVVNSEETTCSGAIAKNKNGAHHAPSHSAATTSTTNGSMPTHKRVGQVFKALPIHYYIQAARAGLRPALGHSPAGPSLWQSRVGSRRFAVPAL